MTPASRLKSGELVFQLMLLTSTARSSTITPLLWIFFKAACLKIGTARFKRQVIARGDPVDQRNHFIVVSLIFCVIPV